jgi:hypothetical protein
MPKLSDAQLVVLSAATQRDDRSVLPLALKHKGAAADKVLNSLLRGSLIEECPAGLSDEVWRQDKDGTRLTLRATTAAFEALGIEAETGPAIEAPAQETERTPEVRMPSPRRRLVLPPRSRDRRSPNPEASRSPSRRRRRRPRPSPRRRLRPQQRPPRPSRRPGSRLLPRSRSQPATTASRPS